MPKNPIYLAPLEAGKFYHICNMTNNRELLFRNEANKLFFLERFDYFMDYLLDVYTWCLIPNHFHFLVKMKSEEDATKGLVKLRDEKMTKTEEGFLEGEVSFPDLALQAFTRFFQSYSTSYNRAHQRKGNLFYSSFSRVHVKDDPQFQRTTVYIHTNPVKHGIIDDFRDYEWSSWKDFVSEGRVKIKRRETYEIFGGKQAFMTAHEIREHFLLHEFPLF